MGLGTKVKQGAKIGASVIKAIVSSLATAIAPLLLYRLVANAVNDYQHPNSRTVFNASDSRMDNEPDFLRWVLFASESLLFLMVFYSIAKFKFRQMSAVQKPSEPAASPLIDASVQVTALKPPVSPFSNFVVTTSDTLTNILPIATFLFKLTQTLGLPPWGQLVMHGGNIIISLSGTVLVAHQDRIFNKGQKCNPGIYIGATAYRHLATVASLGGRFFLISESTNSATKAINIGFTTLGALNIPNAFNFMAKGINMIPPERPMNALGDEGKIQAPSERALTKSGKVLNAFTLGSYAMLDSSLYAFDSLRYFLLLLPFENVLDETSQNIISAVSWGVLLALWGLAYSTKYKEQIGQFMETYNRGGVRTMFGFAPRPSVGRIEEVVDSNPDIAPGQAQMGAPDRRALV